jgi:type VI secretion system protein ImpA
MLIDLDALVAAIPGDNPAGAAVPYLVRRRLEDGRKEINPNTFAPDDPLRPEGPVPADWERLQQLAEETLRGSSKDLLVAARLTEALVKSHGFAGLIEGLRLMRRLVDECWERLWPAIEDGDVEPRLGAIYWLNDEDHGAFFPATIRQVPLIEWNERRFSFRDWNQAQSKNGSGGDHFDRAVAATPAAAWSQLDRDIAESLAEAAALESALRSRVGDAGPSLGELKRALLDVQELVRTVAKRKGATTAKSAAAESHQAAPAVVEPSACPTTSPTGTPPARPTRDEAYARLAEVSALLLELEPQGLVPHLVRRAVKLANLPVAELLTVFVQDAAVLSQLDRELDLGMGKRSPG